jgi:hypothetical protein
MLTNGIVRAEVNPRWRLPVASMPLIRPDRARPIDRVIDYFGGAEQRRAPASAFHTRPGQGRDADDLVALSSELQGGVPSDPAADLQHPLSG